MTNAEVAQGLNNTILNAVPKTSKDPDAKTQVNSGFAVYVGAKRIEWSASEENAIEAAKNKIRLFRTKDRFVPTITVFDCSLILSVAFITDDANGITVHRRNAS